MSDSRISVISDMVRKGDRVADIGTDHAYLAIELVKSGISPFVIACDIAEGPLKNAKSNVKKAGAANIELRLGDGLNTVLPDEVDTIVIAGMGGDMISHIIENAAWLKNSRYELILQPMTSVEDLRRYLCINGFAIRKEKAVISAGRVYSVMKIGFTGEVLPVNPFYCFVGKLPYNIGDAEKTYIKRVFRIALTRKNSLVSVSEKKKEYIELSDVCDKLKNLIEKF